MSSQQILLTLSDATSSQKPSSKTVSSRGPTSSDNKSSNYKTVEVVSTDPNHQLQQEAMQLAAVPRASARAADRKRNPRSCG